MAELTQLIKPSPVNPKDDPAATDLEARMNVLIGKQWLDLKSAYWVYHSWIYESILMYVGNLWLKWNNTRKSYEIDQPADDFTPRPRINRFAPAIDAICSNFQSIPEVEAVPTPKDSYINMGVAEVCNILSDYFIKDTALRTAFREDEEKLSIAGQWFVLAGCFFTNVYVEDVQAGERQVEAMQPMVGMQCRNCDTYGSVTPEEAQASGGVCPQCGQPMEMTDTELMRPQFNEDGSGLMEPITEKRVCCRIEEPLSGYPRAGSRNMQESGIFILADRMNLDRIWSEFGIEDAHADSEYPDGWSLTAENALRFFYEGYSNANLAGKDACLVLRVYIEPKKVKEFPEGAYAIYMNGECKRCEPWPFGEEHPLTKANYKKVPTLFFNRTSAFDLTGVMREFLDYSSLIKLHGMTTAVDPWVVTDSANVEEITGRGDKLIVWSPKGPGDKEPHHAGAGHLDNGIYEMRANILADLDNIAMLSAVWKGEEPSGVKSGVGIDSLRVQAAAMFAGPSKNFANTFKETVRKGVKLYQKHYTLEQLMRICGDNRRAEIEQFKKCNLDEVVEWIATQQGMPRTKEEEKQEMIDLFDRGMLDVNDPGVREKAFKLFGDTGMLGTFNKDASRARYENATIKAGGMPVFMPEVDDNAVHAEIHADQIKSADFLGWSPEAKETMLRHYLETKEVLAQETAALNAPAVPPGPNPAIHPAAAPPTAKPMEVIPQ